MVEKASRYSLNLPDNLLEQLSVMAKKSGTTVPKLIRLYYLTAEYLSGEIEDLLTGPFEIAFPVILSQAVEDYKTMKAKFPDSQSNPAETAGDIFTGPPPPDKA